MYTSFFLYEWKKRETKKNKEKEITRNEKRNKWSKNVSGKKN